MEGRGAGGTDVMIKLKSHEELRSKLRSKSSDLYPVYSCVV